MKTNTETEVSDNLLLEVIKLKESPKYANLAKANKSGGRQTSKWYLCHMYSLIELKKEAKRRNLIDF
jgi:hypothetical protein